MVELLAFLKLDIEVGSIVELGQAGATQRRLVPILGGTVTGTHTGTILGGGADWQEVMPGGGLDIEARYVLKLPEGLVEVDSRGRRHAVPEVLARLDRGEDVNSSDYYFRTAMRLRTAAAGLLYLNSLLLVSVGERRAQSVHLDIYRVT